MYDENKHDEYEDQNHETYSNYKENPDLMSDHTSSANSGFGESKSSKFASQETESQQTSGSNHNHKSSKASKKLARKTAGIVAAAVLFGAVSGGVMTGVSYIGERYTRIPAVSTTLGQSNDSTTNGAASIPVSNTVMDVSDVVEQAMPSVVAINDTMTVQQYGIFGLPETYQAKSSGSGIIIDKTDSELLIATNYHVVSGASDLTVTFSDDNTASAAVKGTDSATDLAVIAVKLSDISSDTLSKIKVATLGDSDNLKAGQQVIAIGNALGYGQSVTVGYVSALNREISDSNGISHTYIQTDAAINPGNSGGALIDLNGNVIGINAAKTASTEVEGVGYAIPISKAGEILDNLKTKQTREALDESAQGFLGIQGTNIDANASKAYGMPVGIYVYKILDDGAAASSDLKEKDIITKFDGQSVTTMDELKEMLTYYKSGSTVTLTVQSLTDGTYQEHDVTVTLGSRPSDNNS